MKTRVILEIEHERERLPSPSLWNTYMTSPDRFWSMPKYFKVTEISREPVKGPKTERQEMFEERVVILNAKIGEWGAKHPRVEPDVVCRAALQAVIDEEEAKR